VGEDVQVNENGEREGCIQERGGIMERGIKEKGGDAWMKMGVATAKSRSTTGPDL
jgi:hypothetical protein